MKRILIIEDEEPLVEALSYTLASEGFEVDSALDGPEGISKFERWRPDLILLDLMLPGIDGIEVCKRIRSVSSVPVLILTAKDSDIDEVLGLEMGADDYVTKPFHTRKLIARIKALLRRSEEGGKEEPRRMVCGELAMDLGKHMVFLRGDKAHLTPIEFRILETLMRHQGKVLPREQIVNEAWEGSFYGSYKTLDVHIRHIREKLEDDPANPIYIETVRGIGYRFENPEEPPGER